MIRIGDVFVLNELINDSSYNNALTIRATLRKTSNTCFDLFNSHLNSPTNSEILKIL